MRLVARQPITCWKTLHTRMTFFHWGGVTFGLNNSDHSSRAGTALMAFHRTPQQGKRRLPWWSVNHSKSLLPGTLNLTADCSCLCSYCTSLQYLKLICWPNIRICPCLPCPLLLTWWQTHCISYTCLTIKASHWVTERFECEAAAAGDDLNKIRLISESANNNVGVKPNSTIQLEATKVLSWAHWDLKTELSLQLLPRAHVLSLSI